MTNRKSLVLPLGLLVGAAMLLVATDASAYKYWGRRQSSNVVDCRNGAGRMDCYRYQFHYSSWQESMYQNHLPQLVWAEPQLEEEALRLARDSELTLDGAGTDAPAGASEELLAALVGSGELIVPDTADVSTLLAELDAIMLLPRGLRGVLAATAFDRAAYVAPGVSLGQIAVTADGWDAPLGSLSFDGIGLVAI
jgi:hypothetical protein